MERLVVREHHSRVRIERKKDEFRISLMSTLVIGDRVDLNKESEESELECRIIILEDLWSAPWMCVIKSL